MVIGLIFLLLLTIVGVSSMQTTTLSERMAGNLRDQQLAFDAAEAALRTAENWLAAIPSEEIPGTCTALAEVSGNCKDWSGSSDLVYPDNLSNLVNLKLAQQSASWWADNAKPINVDNTDPPVSGAPSIANSGMLAGEPYVLIEQLGSGARFETSGPQGGNTNLGPGVRYYRITAYAVGGTDTAVAVLQTTYAKRVTGGS